MKVKRSPSILLALLAGCGGGDRTSLSVDGGARPGSDSGGVGDDPDAALPAAQMFVHTADVLYTIGAPSFDLVEVGSFGLPSDSAMNDLAVTPDGALYGITASELFAIDASTAAATQVASVDGSNNVAMTFLTDGSLLAADKPGNVRRIAPQTGEVEELGEYGDGYGTAGDLVAVADGTMYAIADQGPGGDHFDNNLLLTIDPSTGEYLERVGEIGHGGVFGVAYSGGNVYAFTRDGDVIEVDRSTGEGTVVRSYPEHSFFGAAVTPLVNVE